MERDTFYGDFMVKLIWKLSADLIYHVFSMKIPDNLQTNYSHPVTVKVSTRFGYNLGEGGGVTSIDWDTGCAIF